MGKHVLIAEDDTLLAHLMAKILKRYDVRATVVYNGKEAIEALEKEVPDVLLLDVLMPVLDGHAVLKRMKEKKVRCPVIVVSNLSDKMTMRKCRDMNADHYFVKNDIDDNSLWPVVERYLT